jgi:CBS domain-containing protein
MITVKQLMQTKKDPEIHSVTPDDTVYHALEVMAAANIGAVLVLEKDKMVGIFSERDYARKVILAGRSSTETRVEEIMTEDTITIAPDQTLEECMTLMSEHHIRHLPVMENSRLEGIITMRDVVNAIIRGKDNLIKDLEDYILGQGYPR